MQFMEWKKLWIRTQKNIVDDEAILYATTLVLSLIRQKVVKLDLIWTNIFDCYK